MLVLMTPLAATMARRLSDDRAKLYDRSICGGNKTAFHLNVVVKCAYLEKPTPTLASPSLPI
jgi:hypothetical protein